MFIRPSRIYNRQEIIAWEQELNGIPNLIQRQRLGIQNYNQGVTGWRMQINNIDGQLNNVNINIANTENLLNNRFGFSPMSRRPMLGMGWNNPPFSRPLIIGSRLGGNLYPNIGYGFANSSYEPLQLRLAELYAQRDALQSERARLQGLVSGHLISIENYNQAIRDYNNRNAWLEREIRAGNQYLQVQYVAQPIPVIAPPLPVIAQRIPVVAQPVPMVVQDFPRDPNLHIVQASDENEYQTALTALRSLLDTYPQEDEAHRKMVTRSRALINYIEREKNDTTHYKPLQNRIGNYIRVLNQTAQLAQRPSDPQVRSQYQALMNELNGAPTHNSKLITIMAGVLSAVIVIASLAVLVTSSVYNPIGTVLGSIGLFAGVAGVAGSIAHYKSGSSYRGFAKQVKEVSDAANQTHSNPNLNPNNLFAAPRVNAVPVANPAPVVNAVSAANPVSAEPPSYAEANRQAAMSCS